MRAPLGLILSLVALAACAPSRQTAISRAADAYCSRSITCSWTGTDSYDSCMSNMEDFFNTGWPDSTCKDGQIDNKGFNDCLDTLNTLSCSDWTEGLSSISACDKDTVCRG